MLFSFKSLSTCNQPPPPHPPSYPALLVSQCPALPSLHTKPDTSSSPPPPPQVRTRAVCLCYPALSVEEAEDWETSPHPECSCLDQRFIIHCLGHNDSMWVGWTHLSQACTFHLSTLLAITVLLPLILGMQQTSPKKRKQRNKNKDNMRGLISQFMSTLTQII